MNKKGWIVAVVEAIVFLLIIGIFVKNTSDRIEVLENNVIAYRDSLSVIELKNEELIITKQSLILSEAEMREELDKSKKEIKALKKALNDDIAYISELEAKLEIKDTVYMKGDTVYVYEDWTKKLFKHSDQWYNINASVFGKTISEAEMTIDKLSIYAPIEVGLTDNYMFWVKSPNPNLIITDVKSVTIDNKLLRKADQSFRFGINAGVGLQWGMIGKDLDIGPYIGAGLQYNF